MEIKPNLQKNFIIARVAVNTADLIGKKFFSHNDTQVMIPMGYSLYYTVGDTLERFESGENQKVKSTKLFTKIKDTSDTTTLYWLRKSSDNHYKITVPWGIAFPKGGRGYNGQITLEFNIDGTDFISKCMCACEIETKDGLNYEYLSEYYVNAKNELQGLSVAIRELLVPRLKDCESKKGIECTIKDLAEKLFEPMGLFLDKNSIVVNDFKQLESGSK